MRYIDFLKYESKLKESGVFQWKDTEWIEGYIFAKKQFKKFLEGKE